MTSVDTCQCVRLQIMSRRAFIRLAKLQILNCTVVCVTSAAPETDKTTGKSAHTIY